MFRAGDLRAHIFIVERGSVASRGRMLGPGGLMGLKLALLHGPSEHSGNPGGTVADDSTALWDHTAVSLSYVNMLTLRCQDFHKCVSPCPLTYTVQHRQTTHDAARTAWLSRARVKVATLLNAAIHAHH